MSFLRSELTYCTNVHPGQTVSEIIQNIENYVSRVRKSRALEEMAAGLWISARAAAELKDPEKQSLFIQALRGNGLWPTSINGFPYGSFHEDRVKESVYNPDWSTAERLDYTLDLARLAAALLKQAPEPFQKCAISTVPLGFAANWSEAKHAIALKHLLKARAVFEQISKESGLMITLCLEMEPGCVLETTDQVLALWQELTALNNQQQSQAMVDARTSSSLIGEDASIESIPQEQDGSPGLHHLGLCYDICHQAVMFEDVKESLEALHRNSIPIYKYQISSAIEARWPEARDPGYVVRHEQLLNRLQSFCDNRYLHQTSIQQDQQGPVEYHLDLDKAMKRLRSSARLFWKDQHFAAGMRCRVHYHVPIHLKSLNDGENPEMPKDSETPGPDILRGSQQSANTVDSSGLFTTRDAIESALDFLKARPSTPVLEVETYTWTVLPESIRSKYSDVVGSIGKELDFLEEALESRGLLGPEMPPPSPANRDPGSRG